MCFTLRLHTSAAPPRGGLTQALGRMKINRFLIILVHLSPAIGLFMYGVSTASIQSIQEALVVATRLFFASVLAIAVAVGVTEKFKFLQQENLTSRLAFYFLYVSLFFVSCFMLGLELQFPDNHRMGRYTY